MCPRPSTVGQQLRDCSGRAHGAAGRMLALCRKWRGSSPGSRRGQSRAAWPERDPQPGGCGVGSSQGVSPGVGMGSPRRPHAGMAAWSGSCRQHRPSRRLWTPSRSGWEPRSGSWPSSGAPMAASATCRMPTSKPRSGLGWAQGGLGHPAGSWRDGGAVSGGGSGAPMGAARLEKGGVGGRCCHSSVSPRPCARKSAAGWESWTSPWSAGSECWRW